MSYSIQIENGRIIGVAVDCIPGGYVEITEDEYNLYQVADVMSTYSIVKGKLKISPPSDAAVQEQTVLNAVASVKVALQNHIDGVAIGLGFSAGNALMLYAGFENAFKPLAQAFGAWEATIWVTAGAYMAKVEAGTATMSSPDEAVAQIPEFVFN